MRDASAFRPGLSWLLGTKKKTVNPLTRLPMDIHVPGLHRMVRSAMASLKKGISPLHSEQNSGYVKKNRYSTAGGANSLRTLPTQRIGLNHYHHSEVYFRYMTLLLEEEYRTRILVTT